MAPLTATHTAARIAFYVPLAIFVLGEWRVRLRSVMNREGARAEGWSRALVYLGLVAGIVGAVLLGHLGATAIDAVRVPLFVLGIVLMAAGIVVRQWAVALLGALFTTDVRVHEDQRVVDTGPYRWVRHPSYTGLLLICAGIALAQDNWAALLAGVLLPLPVLVMRIRVEEAALLAGLGEPYRRFAAGRAHLVPGVW